MPPLRGGDGDRSRRGLAEGGHAARREGVCSKNESHKKALWYLSIEGDGLVAVQCPCYECPRKSRGAVTAPPATTARDGTLGRKGIKVVSHMTASRRKSEGKVHERKDVLWGKARACA